MKFIIKKLTHSAVITVASLLISTTAYAFTIEVNQIQQSDGDANTNGPGLFSQETGAITVDFDSPIPTGFSYSGGKIVNGSVGGQWASPPEDNTNYFTVGRTSDGQASPGILSLGSLHQYFGFYGGSPDGYNRIEFWRDGQMIDFGSFTGDELTTYTNFDADGNQNNGAYWDIWAENSSEYFDEVRFYSVDANGSEENAFETDNHAVVSAVPIPAAVWLFGSGIIGLLGFSSRNKTA